MRTKRFNALPGFGLTMGFTMFYLSVIVLIPLAGLFFRVSQAGWRSQDFVPRDFHHADALADQLKEHSDPVSQFLWQQFPDSTRQSLSNHVSGESSEVEA